MRRCRLGRVAVALRLYWPSAGGSEITDEVPVPSTVAVPIMPKSSDRMIRSPAMPVPLIAGVVKLVMVLPWGPLSLAGARAGADGGDWGGGC